MMKIWTSQTSCVGSGEQQSAFAALGCDEFQGYFYSPPLAASPCLDYLKSSAATAEPTSREKKETTAIDRQGGAWFEN